MAFHKPSGALSGEKRHIRNAHEVSEAMPPTRIASLEKNIPARGCWVEFELPNFNPPQAGMRQVASWIFPGEISDSKTLSDQEIFPRKK